MLALQLAVLFSLKPPLNQLPSSNALLHVHASLNCAKQKKFAQNQNKKVSTQKFKKGAGMEECDICGIYANSNSMLVMKMMCVCSSCSVAYLAAQFKHNKALSF